MPKIVTRQTRIAEAQHSAARLRSAMAGAREMETVRDATDREKAAMWAEAAEAAGQIQRRARQLAGLGRGG